MKKIFLDSAINIFPKKKGQRGERAGRKEEGRQGGRKEARTEGREVGTKEEKGEREEGRKKGR